MPDYSANRLIIRLRGFDAQHYARTTRYARQVEQLYKSACDEIAAAAGRIAIPEDGVFSFDDFPATKKQAEGILTRLTRKVEAVITNGTQTEWEAACDKSDAFLNSILKTSRLSKDEAEQYEARNLEALQAFQQRKAGGLGLSQRVWKYTDEFKTAMELGIDVAVGEGRSAAELSRDLRSYLQAPDKLFRRVRDKGGNLRLSKAAAVYHPGQGVYRSSAKNAQRLARTEINMAYREAEYLRWQQLDFVVGFRVMLSNNHTVKNSKGEDVELKDICDELAGDYPKTFKFLGWHPQCRCCVVPIMSDYDEYNKDRAGRLKAIVRGQTYKSLPSRRTVRDVPAAFRDHIAMIEERAKGWKSMPYYIRDNFKGGRISGGLLPQIPQKSGAVPGSTAQPPTPCTDFDNEIADQKKWAYAFGLDVSALDRLRTAGNKAELQAELKRIQALRADRQKEWTDIRQEIQDYLFDNAPRGFGDVFKETAAILANNEIQPANYYGHCIGKLKAFFTALPGKIAAALAPDEKLIKDLKERTQQVIDGSDLETKIKELLEREKKSSLTSSYSFVEHTDNFKMDNRKVRDVDVYTTPSGIKIVIPSDSTIGERQSYTVGMIAKQIATLPDEMRATIKEVYLCDYANPKDWYWEQEYNDPDFYSFATGGNGTIRFYQNKGNEAKLIRKGLQNGAKESRIPGTLHHECGHNLDTIFSTISGSDIWKEAVEYDKKKNGFTAVSDYGKKHVREDFAESFKFFIKNRENFKKKFPARYAIIRQILQHCP